MLRKLIMAILVASGGAALADYHYAAHDGSNEYPYTSWETAADSIQKAVDAAVAGDTVFIGAGHWYELVDFYDSDTLAAIGMGTDSTFCHGGTWIFDEVTNGCLIENITFLDASGGCIYGRLNAGFVVNNCRFENSIGGIGATGHPNVISNCVFENCTVAIGAYVGVGYFFVRNNLTLNCYSDIGVFDLWVQSAVVENNILIQPYLSGVLAISVLSDPDSASIRNNIVVNCSYGIGGGRVSRNNVVRGATTGGMSVLNGRSRINNVLVDCRRGVFTGPNDTVTLNYNDFWHNQVDIDPLAVVDSIGNIFCDPMFVSADDFHLQAFSPLIDAGDPDILDLDGTRSDIGAYGGPYGESYNYQDLPPAVPDSLSGVFESDTIFLAWRYNTEADFSHYLLHRDTVSGFEPSSFNLIAQQETSYFQDTDVSNEHNFYYRLAAVDNQENLSAYSEELQVITTGIWDGTGPAMPQITSIRTSYPNPFNVSTAIVYWVANLGPIPAEIRIDIYDVVGRKVRTLVNERKELGEHVIIWDGRDDRGADCSSGVYFGGISQWSLEVSGRPRKLILVR